jgi:hypothetical protein
MPIKKNESHAARRTSSYNEARPTHQSGYSALESDGTELRIAGARPERHGRTADPANSLLQSIAASGYLDARHPGTLNANDLTICLEKCIALAV